MGWGADVLVPVSIVLVVKVTIGVTLSHLALCWHGLQCSFYKVLTLAQINVQQRRCGGQLHMAMALLTYATQWLTTLWVHEIVHSLFANNNECAPRDRNTIMILYWKFKRCWTQLWMAFVELRSAGMNITIDESMIQYSGRAVSWVQYMLAKPIEHGIKVFAACCAYSGVLLAYDV